MTKKIVVMSFTIYLGQEAITWPGSEERLTGSMYWNNCFFYVKDIFRSDWEKISPVPESPWEKGNRRYIRRDLTDSATEKDLPIKQGSDSAFK